MFSSWIVIWRSGVVSIFEWLNFGEMLKIGEGEEKLPLKKCSRTIQKNATAEVHMRKDRTAFWQSAGMMDGEGNGRAKMSCSWRPPGSWGSLLRTTLM